MKKQKLFKPTQSGKKKFNGRLDRDQLYAGDWIRFRKQFIAANPKCYACGKWASETDHLTPHLGNVALFWKETNFLPLCERCHSTVTAKFDRNHVAGTQPIEKLKWLAEQRVLHDIHSSVKIVNVPLDVLMKHGLKRF